MRNDLHELEQQVEKLIQLSERLEQENRHPSLLLGEQPVDLLLLPYLLMDNQP